MTFLTTGLGFFITTTAWSSDTLVLIILNPISSMLCTSNYSYIFFIESSTLF